MVQRALAASPLMLGGVLYAMDEFSMSLFKHPGILKCNRNGVIGKLFSYFRGNGEDGLYLAYSHDGLEWVPLNRDQPLLRPEVGGKLMRDPCITQGEDGVFHMVWTTGWHDNGIGFAHSKDLINWSPQTFLPVMKHEKEARNCWAPETCWDPVLKRFYVFWATTIPGRFPETDKSGNNRLNHRIYCTSTPDFKSFAETELFYDPGFNVIDSTIVYDKGRFVMVLKDETVKPAAKNLRVATASSITGPWSTDSDAFTPEGLWVEGPSLLKTGSYWYVYYDAYQKHHYGVMRTRDFRNWENLTERLKFPAGARHGTAFAVSPKILEQLKALGSTKQR